MDGWMDGFEFTFNNHYYLRKLIITSPQSTSVDCFLSETNGMTD